MSLGYYRSFCWKIQMKVGTQKKPKKTAYLFYLKCFFWVSQCLTVHCYYNNRNSQVVSWNLTIYCQIQGMPASAPFIRMGLMSISLWNCRAWGDSVWRRQVWGAGVRSTQEGLTSPILQGICLCDSNPSRIACSSALFWLPTRLLQLMTARETEMSQTLLTCKDKWGASREFSTECCSVYL